MVYGVLTYVEVSCQYLYPMIEVYLQIGSKILKIDGCFRMSLFKVN